MKLGIALRNMGPQSAVPILTACARAADDAGLDDLWVADHIAIPPDDAEGSGGRYLDPLATLAYLAGVTRRIGLGTGVLVLPYRPPLATAKWVATVQEVSGGRLRLGVGVGWMPAEFRAAGVDRGRRGRITDETLAFLQRCFAADEVEANGQHFLFLPRPERPPILVGGEPPHAFTRVLRYGDGWMPVGSAPDKLAPLAAQLREQASTAGRPRPLIVAMTRLPLDDPGRAAEVARRYAASGADGLVHGGRYEDAAAFARAAAGLVEHVRPAVDRR